MAAWLIFVLVFGSLGLIIQSHWQKNMSAAQSNYVRANHDATLSHLNQLEIALDSIYQNIRTLAQLPSVRAIDRHATNISDEARVTFQQIYNNLATSVDVSEVYIVPIDMNPDNIDPITSKPEQPILMFDELILNAASSQTFAQRISGLTHVSNQPLTGPPEVETFEYKQLVDQASWLKAKYPTNQNVDGFNTPFIAGRETITCDNTKFIKTLNDNDRKGIIFSVPFYSAEGKLKGMISAIMLTNALKGLLPAENLALVNPGNDYATLAKATEKLVASQNSIETATPDPALLYSEAIALPIKDYRSPWYVWAGRSNDDFANSKDVVVANQLRSNSLITLAILALLGSVSIYLAQTYFSQSAKLQASLAHSKNIAEESAVSSQETAEQLRVLNEDISVLNTTLAQKIKLLTEAQADIVRKGKMAQLGNLVATVAHELRNPLGGVRTTTFMLKRKLKDSPIDVSTQLNRIESGVTRCDNIISQLLDFSRTQPLNSSETNLSIWLQNILEEEVPKLPESISVQCLMTEHDVIAQVDPERLRRGVINLLSNAAEAMTAKNVVNATPPALTIELKKSPRGIEILVADNGPGIPADILEKIGEPLFTTKSFGTGLGIAAVQKITELHGGGLEIRSEAGHGATFTIWFPAQAGESIAA
jgi:signal transduction histidine kinase